MIPVPKIIPEPKILARPGQKITAGIEILEKKELNISIFVNKYSILYYTVLKV